MPSNRGSVCNIYGGSWKGGFSSEELKKGGNCVGGAGGKMGAGVVMESA